MHTIENASTKLHLYDWAYV